jgi:hypothetical protein
MGVLGCRCGERRGREEVKVEAVELVKLLVEEGKGTAGRGVRRSDVMVMGSAKSVGVEVKAAKASCRSVEAGGSGVVGQTCTGRRRGGIRRGKWWEGEGMFTGYA